MTTTDGKHKITCYLHGIERADHPVTTENDGTIHPASIRVYASVTFEGMGSMTPLQIYIRDEETSEYLLTTWINYLASMPMTPLPTVDLYIYVRAADTSR